MFLDVFLDALFDALKVLPVVFIIYIIIELIENHEATKHKMTTALGNRFSPVFGALIGVIPQCGFSVVATKLYQGKFIYLGTLIAVYFATSDEAIPILFSRALTDSSVWLQLGLLVAIKLVYAIVVGFVINCIIAKCLKKQVATNLIDFADKDFENDRDGCCGHSVEKERKDLKHVVFHPLLHSLKIIAYIFIVNLVLGSIIDLAIGEERFYAFLTSSVAFQPLFSALVGLIPNCASSVIIAELYADGMLKLGGALAGLTINSGLGIAILIKDKGHVKRSLSIIGIMFALALLLGYATLWIG